MKHYILLTIFLFFNISVFSQSLKPKYGVELSSSLKKIDTHSAVNSPALSGYIGIFSLVPLKSERFSAKFCSGLNFTSIHRDELHFLDNGYGGYGGINQGEGDYVVFPEINTVLTTLSVSVELRYYLLPGKPSWGNLYASLPLIFESKPFIDSWMLRSGFRVMPGIGYRYEFNKHWAIETDACVGWGYLKSDINAFNNKTISEYSASLRIGYTF